MINFPDATVAHKFKDGSKILRMRSAVDLGVLAQHGGGCARAHSYWVVTCRPISEYFFVLQGKEGNIQMILFCKRADLYGKKHPQDIPGNPSVGWLKSDHYDKYRQPKPSDAKQYYEERLRLAKEDYEYYKREGVKLYGPLGKDHPWKQRIDSANRRVVEAKEALEKCDFHMLLAKGATFKYNKTKLVVIEKAVPYGSREANARESNEKKMIEFCEKGGLVGAS